MDNIINLSDRRKADDEPQPLPENAMEIMEDFLETYMDMAIEDMPLGLLIVYAKTALEQELRSLPFLDALKQIEKEYPELACKFRADMSI